MARAGQGCLAAALAPFQPTAWAMARSIADRGLRQLPSPQDRRTGQRVRRACRTRRRRGPRHLRRVRRETAHIARPRVDAWSSSTPYSDCRCRTGALCALIRRFAAHPHDSALENRELGECFEGPARTIDITGVQQRLSGVVELRQSRLKRIAHLVEWSVHHDLQMFHRCRNFGAEVSVIVDSTFTLF